MIAAPTPRRRHLARAARDGAASAPKQTGGRGAAAAAKTSTFASASRLVSSCRRRTRARSASLREDTRTGIRTGSIRLPVRMPVNRATEWCWCLAQQVQLLIYDWFFVRRRGSTADAGGGGGGGCSRTWAGCGARTAAAARRRCCSAADDEDDAAPAAPPARPLPARSVTSLHPHTGRDIGARGVVGGAGCRADRRALDVELGGDEGRLALEPLELVWERCSTRRA